MNEAKTQPGQIILTWWFENVRPKPDFETGATRAFRARLRRADRALDVMSEPQCLELYEKLHSAPGKHSRDPLVFSALIPVLSRVSVHQQFSIARAFGNGDPRPLSHLRFQKIIRLDDFDALGSALRRSLSLIDGSCNVSALGYDFLCWFSEDKRFSEKTRTHWCFDYFSQMSPTKPKKTDDMEGLS